MKDYHINLFYSEDDEGYIADIPDLQHCSAFGATPEEALREVLKAKETWLDAARERQSHSRAAVSSSHLPSCVRPRLRSPNVQLLPLSRPHVEGNLPHVMGATHR